MEWEQPTEAHHSATVLQSSPSAIDREIRWWEDVAARADILAIAQNGFEYESRWAEHPINNFQHVEVCHLMRQATIVDIYRFDSFEGFNNSRDIGRAHFEYVGVKVEISIDDLILASITENF